MNRRVFFKYLVALPFIPAVALATKSSDIGHSWKDASYWAEESFATTHKYLVELREMTASLNEISQVDSALNAIKFSGDVTC